LLFAQEGLQALKGLLPPALAQAEGSRNDECNVLGSYERGKFNKAAPIGEGLLHVCRDLEGQASLANPPRASHG
jgi:hypothetical protein